MARGLGSIYTPPDIAKFLTSWAIQNPSDRVLDVGVGEGIFAFAAYHRLTELGARASDAQRLLQGSEIDEPTYGRFLELASERNLNFPNIHRRDFFESNLSTVDAVVGNPPYVRRTYIEDVDRIRQSVSACNNAISEADLSRLTDLSIYFLLRALVPLSPGGRLAVVTTDSWLNSSYGKTFKEYLLENLTVEYLISLDRRVFEDAQVKPVLLLATKRQTEQSGHTDFVRVRNGLPIRAVQELLTQPNLEDENVRRFAVRHGELTASKPWGLHFKAPELYEELLSHDLMTPIAHLAGTRIGIQTLAKDFFVLTADQVEMAQIESDYLEPLAQSSRYYNGPTIEEETSPLFYLFCCSKSKEELQGTRALEYILKGEATTVEVRGKGTTVVGYHNKKRIQKSNRKPWYNLRTILERRGRGAILVPRLIYRTFAVVWNKASFAPGELFIEFLPLPLGATDVEVYLAVLTSSISEVMLRAHAQVYGGGTYNIKPGQIKNVPILNVAQLSAEQKGWLKQAYNQFLEDKNHDRSAIDDVVYQLLGFSKSERQGVEGVLQDLLQIATDSKKMARQPTAHLAESRDS